MELHNNFVPKVYIILPWYWSNFQLLVFLSIPTSSLQRPHLLFTIIIIIAGSENVRKCCDVIQKLVEYKSHDDNNIKGKREFLYMPLHAT